MADVKKLLRTWGIGFLIFLMVMVDSVSQILSMIEDGFFAACMMVIWWFTKSRKKE